MSNETFTVTVDLTYYPHLIPPRCRKPRPVATTVQVSVEVPVLTAADAPVAALVPERYGDDQEPVEIRHYDGEFYQARLDHNGNPVAAGSDQFPARREVERHVPSIAEAQQYATENLSELVIIDGFVWYRTSEPVYYIATFGFGNGTGTAIFIESRTMAQYRASSDAIFSALEPDVAIAEAVKVAKKRGDDNSVEHIPDINRVTVLDVAAPWQQPTRDQRLRSAHHELSTELSDIADVLSGPFVSRDDLREVVERVKKAQDRMWDEGITSLES